MDTILPTGKNFAIFPLLLALIPCSCSHISDEEYVEPGQTSAVVGSESGFGDSMQADFLLSMSYREAANLASQAMDVPPYYRVAADNIKHPPILDGKALDSFSAEGSPVFIEINYPDAPLIAICGEAEVTSKGVELRKRAALRRGMSVLEATSDETVIFLTQNRVWTEGPHRLREVGQGRSVASMGGNPLFDVDEDMGSPLPTPATTNENLKADPDLATEDIPEKVEKPLEEAKSTEPEKKKRRGLFGLFAGKKDKEEKSTTPPVYSEAKVTAPTETAPPAKVTTPKVTTPEVPKASSPASPPTPKIDAEAPPQQPRKGLLNRLFGSKSTKAVPAPTAAAPTKKVGGTEFLIGPPKR